MQISECLAVYGKYLKFRQALVYGGVSQVKQVRMLNRGIHILVATPGRLIDLMNQGHIQLNQLEVFVLDEVDRMLDMGFLPDLKRIINCLPSQRQSLFFSATLPPKIRELSNCLLTNPVCINVTPKSTSIEQIEQRVLFVERSGKRALLQKVLSAKDVARALVFTRTKRGANLLAEKLVRGGIKATAIHGNKSQSARERALLAFRHDHVQVLVATDVAARGIDIDGITHVVNFDIPIQPESYVHRIGRTGRAGASGMALSFCSINERTELRAIEKFIGMQVPHFSAQTHPDRGSRIVRESGLEHSVGCLAKPMAKQKLPKSKSWRRRRRRNSR
jgi:ATP-dependent RNA helicase RhlE